MKLFEPGKIGRMTVKNRVVMAAMNASGLINLDCTLSQRGIDYLVARARGGVGLIVTGATRVTRELEYAPLMHRVQLVDGGIHINWLSELADGVHDYGARVAVQLQPGRGRIATKRTLKSIGVATPSPVTCFYDPTVTSREMTISEIEKLVKSFEVAGETLNAAGIDAAELNFHAGYVGDGFVTALWNKRTDRYGGDLDGRMRFPLEVIASLRKGAGADFPIIYKFGLMHYIKGGREIDEGLEIARRLEAAGVNAFTIDAGCYDSFYWPFPTTYQPPGLLVHVAEALKKVVNIPVIAVGKLGYPALAERVLQENKADFIALGRPLLADPEWPNKVKAGTWEDICPCIGDNEGCFARVRDQKYISCSVNPAAGMEKELAPKPAERKKFVLVIGGGPAGMTAARIAALRGHRVTVWEKEKFLGGALVPASAPGFKQDYRDLMNYLSLQLQKQGVSVELGKEARPELILEAKPEVLFIATGAVPSIPNIPGIHMPKVITATDFLTGKRASGANTVVVGGGFIGCETAVYLAQQGKHVTIIEVLKEVARDMFTSNRMYMVKMLADAEVEILTGTNVLEINDNGVLIRGNDGINRTITADTVICATGLKSYEPLSETLRNAIPEVYTIGDCVEPRKVINAIWEGFRTALII